MTAPGVGLEEDGVVAAPSFVRSFFQQGAIYALGGVLSQGISFVLFPFFAHVFAPHDYGLIDLIALSTTLVNLTIALEISQGLVRHFIDASDAGERQAYASTALIFTAALYTTALIAALIAIGPLTTLLLGSNRDTRIMSVGVVSMWFSGMLYLTQDLLRWQLRPRAFAFVSVVTATVTTCSSAILVLGFDTGVLGAIIGQAIGFGTGAAFAFWLSHDLYRLTFDSQKLRRMLAYSVPLVPASVGVFINGYADRLAIRSRLTIADLGVYGVGYRLSMVVSLTLIGFQGALAPLTLSRHELPRTRDDLARIFRLFCAIALAVFLCVSIFADELLRILARPAYYGAVDVVPLVVAASFFGGMYVFAPGLVIAKRTRPTAIVSAGAGLVNLGLAFGLVGPLGIRGPALAFLLTCAASFTALMYLSQREYRVPHRWIPLLSTALSVAALVAISRWQTDGHTSPWEILTKFGYAAFGLSLVVGVLLNHDDRRSLAHLPRLATRAFRSLLRTARQRRRETPV